MFMLSSTTKGVTATCMHILAEKHKLDYDMPIVKVWPEFGAHGKEAATLRDALSHRTGVPQTPVGYTPEWLPTGTGCARASPTWSRCFPWPSGPPTHSLNYGYINGEILRRVDGRGINQFLQEESASHSRSTASIWECPTPNCRRVAVAQGRAAGPGRLRSLDGGRARGFVRRQGVQPQRGPAGGNPGSGGIMSARGLARPTPMLANWGELDGGGSCPSHAFAPAWRCRASSSTYLPTSARCARSAIAVAARPARWRSGRDRPRRRRRILRLFRSQGGNLGIASPRIFFYETGTVTAESAVASTARGVSHDRRGRVRRPGIAHT
jgi:CubicO group peptidase (beta-lactamase class C family)